MLIPRLKRYLWCRAWQVSANLVEPGENALVLHSGYFADSFADW